MLKKYKFVLVFIALVVGLAAVVQGCGSGAPLHTVFGSTS